jgi:putative ABC transport system permease protein
MGGVLGCFIGVALLSPFIARPVVSLLGRLFSWSVPGKLGRLNSGRNPRRTAITAAALMVGIALVTGFNTVMTSAERSFRGDVARNFHGDLVISGQESPGVMPTFDPALLPRMQSVPGVQTVVATYADQILVDNHGPVSGYVQTDLPAVLRLLSVPMVAGSATPGPREVVVDEARGYAIGEILTIRTAKGVAESYTVTGIFKDQELFGGYQFGPAMIEGMRSQQPVFAYVDLKDGADVTAARKGLEALLVDSPEMNVQNQKEYIDSLTGEITQFLLMIQVLLGLAILIAILGVINTLALSVLERTRELGLLRAIGLGRMATMRMVTVEAVVITLFGALLGLGVGAGLGSAVVKGLADDGFSELVLPWEQMGVYLAVGAVVGVLAAVLPAIKAARTNVLNAIAYE